MKSVDFIVKYYRVDDGKRRTCSSIVKGGDGTIFSYGEHYPLLFVVNGYNVRNIQGYSVTTAKHIAWAGSLPSFIYDVKLLNSDYSPEAVRISLIAEMAEIRDTLNAKKRKDTKIFKEMHARYLEAKRALNAIF